MFVKDAQTSVPIADVIAKRWSGVAFDPDRHISHADLTAMLEAARWAPSCYGDQPWRYVVWRRNTDEMAWKRACLCLAEANQSWARSASVLMLATAASQFEHNGKPNRWGQYDTGAATVSLCLQAAALGIMTHQMGGFDAAEIRKEFAIPERYDCMAMIAAGYQLSEDRIPGIMKEREYRARRRRALSETFFSGAWGTGLDAWI
jgi:nitroreductase